MTLTEKQEISISNHRAACNLAYGSQGSFAMHIGKAYLAADSGNQERLAKAFPEWLCPDPWESAQK